MKNSIASIVSRGWRAAVWRAGQALGLSFLTGIASAQLVDISGTPLNGGRQPHANVAVTLSVEVPTVGAAYKSIPYVPASVYLGYFNAAKCYSYVTDSGGYFAPAGNADARHECSDKFSGNFMNWATMSAIDEFRYAVQATAPLFSVPFYPTAPFPAFHRFTPSAPAFRAKLSFRGRSTAWLRAWQVPYCPPRSVLETASRSTS